MASGVAGLSALTTVSCKDHPKSTAVIPPVPAVAQPAAAQPQQSDEFAPGIAYTNYVDHRVPWSVQVVRVDRNNLGLELHSIHARNVVCGLGTLSEVISAVPPSVGEPVAGVNGDFFLRDRAYAGDPRGLQIVDGNLISGASGGAVFWIDEKGPPHAAVVESAMQVTWPDGTRSPIGLNEPRAPGAAVLYTSALGSSTATRDGLEFVLEAVGPGPWYPLKVGTTFKARVKEIHQTPNTMLPPQSMVLSVGPVLAAQLGRFKAGAELTLATTTTPDLRGAETAIGGGPVLLREGRIVEIERPPSLMAVPYSVRSMFERHPRTAVGWNDRFIYLVQVDGRQRDLSMGMTLAELSRFFLDPLRCTDAMNLDGGGSSTFWANGQTRNSPCEGHERELANALLVIHKSGTARAAGRPGQSPGG